MSFFTLPMTLYSILPAIHRLVAGGASSQIDPDSVAFHPSWRKALALIYISESWDENASVDGIRAAQQRLIDNTGILDTISTDSAAYYNEVSKWATFQ